MVEILRRRSFVWVSACLILSAISPRKQKKKKKSPTPSSSDSSDASSGGDMEATGREPLFTELMPHELGSAPLSTLWSRLLALVCCSPRISW